MHFIPNLKRLFNLYIVNFKPREQGRCKYGSGLFLQIEDSYCFPCKPQKRLLPDSKKGTICEVTDNYQTQMWLHSFSIPTLTKTLHSFGLIPSFKNVPGISKFQSAVKWSETWRRPGGWKINVMTPERAGKHPPAAGVKCSLWRGKGGLNHAKPLSEADELQPVINWAELHLRFNDTGVLKTKPCRLKPPDVKCW